MIKLWENKTPYFQTEYGQNEPWITPYLIEDGEIHPCIIVFPGGGYKGRARHEAEPIAAWLNSIGISAFLLEYRVQPYTYKAILGDAQRAVRLVRYRADEFKIDPEKIGVLGFSAGGHLACMTALCKIAMSLDGEDPVDSVSGRPDLAVLCYPVVSFVNFEHLGSVENFLKEEATWEMRRRFSGEEIVTEDAPPMFLWHTVGDTTVPVENSIRLAKALHAKNVPFSLHIYPNGNHGKGLAVDIPQTSMWTEDCQKWLYEIFEMEEKG